MSNMNRGEIFIVNSRHIVQDDQHEDSRELGDLHDKSIATRFVYFAVVSGDQSCRNGLFNLPTSRKTTSRKAEIAVTGMQFRLYRKPILDLSFDRRAFMPK